MMSRKTLLSLSITLLIAASCRQSEPTISDEATYMEEYEAWKNQRLERLKSEKGWLNLAGLFWLEEGENSFGSDSANDIIFPEKAAPFCGRLILTGGKVRLLAEEGSGITVDGEEISELELRDDLSTSPNMVKQGELGWYIIKRGDLFGIRLRDFAHPRLEALQEIPAFPPDPNYVVEAELHPFDTARTVVVSTPVEGFTESYTCRGELKFRLQGKKLSLLPFDAGKGYFLVIADETSADETYGAGRFMYVIPDSTGRIILDFNRAYNPPCAFSPYATCPMPPLENFLPVAIHAGEKAVHLD